MPTIEALVPAVIVLTVFGSIVTALRHVVDARVRRQMVEHHASEELVKSMLEADERHRRLSALKWGLVLTLVGLAFGLIGMLHLDGDNPGTFGLLFGAAGAGMLIYHAIADRRKA